MPTIIFFSCLFLSFVMLAVKIFANKKHTTLQALLQESILPVKKKNKKNTPKWFKRFKKQNEFWINAIERNNVVMLSRQKMYNTCRAILYLKHEYKKRDTI